LPEDLFNFPEVVKIDQSDDVRVEARDDGLRDA
jgi:hypothetical protein